MSIQACSQDFSWGGGDAYLKNQDQTFNIGMIGTRFLWVPGGILAWKHFEVLDPNIAGNAIKL